MSGWFVVKSFSYRGNVFVPISFRELTMMSDKFCSGYRSSFFNSWEAEKLRLLFFKMLLVRKKKVEKGNSFFLTRSESIHAADDLLTAQL